MQTARIKLILFSLGLLVMGAWLGVFTSERLATYRGVTEADRE
jgi:hypothetical protein